MTDKVYQAWKEKEFAQAGYSDLIELLPNAGGNHLYFPKWILDILIQGICSGEYIHLSGPSGSAKTALLESLMVEENFRSMVNSLGLPYKPLKVYAIEMPSYETPGEFQFRRSLKDGSTFDEKSDIVRALEEAQQLGNDHYVMIWLREMGRVHSSSVQGGLLNLMSKAEVILRDGSRLNGGNICWVADSNYQAEGDSQFSLVPLDSALQRRFSLNLTIDYLDPEAEMKVLGHIIKKDTDLDLDNDLLKEVITLGAAIRNKRMQGSMLSVPPPSIYGYLTYYRMATQLPHLGRQLIARATLLGHANAQDAKQLPIILNDIFSMTFEDEDTEAQNSTLF
jgi:hypothetical protein